MFKHRATFVSLIVLAGAAAPGPAQSPPLPPPLYVAPTQPTQSPLYVAPSQPPLPPASTLSQPTPTADTTFGPAIAPSQNPLFDRLTLTPTIRPRGRVETDAVVSVQSQASKDAIGDLQNGYGFRRVRLGAEGEIGDSASWVTEAELAGGSVRLRDVFVALDALPGIRQLRVGHFREPFSLEGMTSSNYITFEEFSPVNVLSPARNWGLCAYWWPDSERLLFSWGVFRDGTGTSGQSMGDGDNWAHTLRLTGLPVYEPDCSVFRLVHLGAAVSQRVPPNGVLSFQPRTGSNLISVDDNPGTPFLSTINIDTNSYQIYNLQAATVNGPWSFQTEWTGAAVQQTDAGVIFVSGVYVFGSYFLTGEHRGYDRTRGSFHRVNVKRPVIRSKTDPRGGYGAFELITRFSYLDFSSSNLPPDVNGNPAQTRLYELTLGLNWYLNDYTRVMLNYTAGMPDKIAYGTTVAHIFGIRTAIYW